jgi:hypothetical protein
MKNAVKKFLLCNVMAFDAGPAWKLDDNGSVVIKDGNPVYLDSSGTEKTIALNTISNLNNEARSHREQKEEALNKLKAFDGIDPVKAREAFSKLELIDQSKLIDAGKVDEVKNQITTQFQGQLNDVSAERDKWKSDYENLTISNIFANSEFIRNNLNVPRDMFEATFRKHFSMVDGKLVITDNEGNQLFSKTRAGELASSEEALEILANMHPQKDIILRADVGSGSGSNGGGGHSGGAARISRAEFAKKTPAQQAEISAKVRKGEMKLTD